MNKLKRMAALVMCAVMICVTLCACSGDEQAETTAPATPGDVSVQDTQTLRLPYSKSDTLDPYHAESMINRQLSALIYDSLFTIDDTFDPEPLIAESVTASGLTLTVKLKSGAVFTDLSHVTARDVVYSFDCAKDSPVYASRLSGFKSASENGESAVVFTLESPDPYAASCLTFAVVKDGTADGYEERTKDTGYREATENIPTGGGRYIPQVKNGDITLTAFRSRLGGFLPRIVKIALVDCPNSESMPYTLEIGEISFFFNNLSTGSYRRISASIDEIPMNNLVYLGINSGNSPLASPAVRRTLVKLIDREYIAMDSYAGHATPSAAPFNPKWSKAASLTAATGTDSAQAIADLENEGYRSVSDYGVRYSGATGRSLNFDMLVCEGSGFRSKAAEYIKSALAKANITVNISELEYEEYMEAVAGGKFDLYLGEIRLSANMSLSPFFGKDGGASFGINAERELEQSYASFLEGKTTMADFTKVFCAYAPFIPLCWRTGMSCCTREMTSKMNSCDGDVYRDIEHWTFLTE